MNKCIGCGLPLQDQNKDELGYTPNLKNTYCMRCFRLKNYGEQKEENLIDNAAILKKINHQKGVVFFLIDYLNLNLETLSYFKSITLPKVLLISKSDTLRSDIKFTKIKYWLKKVYNITSDIYFVSGKTNFINVNIFKYTTNLGYNNCYIMGITNAGKSTFINNILKDHNIKKEIVVSNKANTTLDFIKFKIADCYLYDTPGFIYNTLSSALITKEIKPLTYNITKPTTIKIMDYYFYFSTPNKITCYLSTPKVQKEFKSYEGYSLSISANHDLVLPGLGFINIKNATTIISNLNNLETRLDISGVDYE